MSADPELIPPPLVSPAPLPRENEDEALPAASRPGSIPHLGHMALFVAMLVLAGLLVGLVLTGFVEHLPPFRHETFAQLQTDPRIVIPLEAAMYGIAVWIAWLVFPRLWHEPLLRGLRWNSATVRRFLPWLAGIGVILSISVQLLSNFLPIPKSLPIDKFFQNPVGVWIVALFGVTVAPFFEELAFRGFLLPSLANAWDWIAHGPHYRNSIVYPVERATLSMDPTSARPRLEAYDSALGHAEERDPLRVRVERQAAIPSAPWPTRDGDPHWSGPAMVFATIITSIGFALLHSEQLAHAYAPLGVLFSVSLVLCIVRLRTHSLAASAFVHACYNGTIFLLLFLSTSGFRHLEKLRS